MDVLYDGHALSDSSLLHGLKVSSEAPGGDHHDHWTCSTSGNAADGALIAGEDANIVVSQLDGYGNRMWVGGDAQTAAASVSGALLPRESKLRYTYAT